MADKYGNIIFRYKDGILRPMKATNSYMNDFIRGKEKKYKIPDEKIIGIYNRKTNKYAERRFFVSEIAPDDFLKLTTDSSTLADIIDETNFKLDTNILDKSYMFLNVNMQTGKVMGHEGRHRMVALKNAGYDKAQIVIFPEFGTMNGFKEFNYFKLQPQTNNAIANDYVFDFDKNVVLKKVIPIDEEYIKKINRGVNK